MKSRLHLIILVLLSAIHVATKAQLADSLFLHFPASEYPVRDGILPMVGISSPIFLSDEEMSADDVSVFMEFPEYADLTKAEENELARYLAEISDEVKIQWTISYIRRNPLIDISFNTIIRSEGKLKRLTSCKLAITRRDTSQSLITSQSKARAFKGNNSSRYAEHSVLANGKWVKISVKEEGMYEMSASQLSKWGFNDISKVKLYGYGGQLQPEKLVFSGENAIIDDLCEVPLYRKSSSLLFYANGTVRWDYNSKKKKYSHADNYYSSNSYYFLTEGDNPLTIEKYLSDSDATSAATISIVAGHSLYDANAFMWYEGGRRMFDSYDFATGARHSYRVDAPGIANLANGETSTLDVAFSAANPLTSTALSVSVNDKQVGTQQVSAYGANESAKVSTQSYPLNGELKATNTITLNTSNTNNARLDYLLLNYPRELDGSQDPFSFIIDESEPTRLTIKNADSGTQVWELQHGATALREISTSLNNGILTTSVIPNNTRLALVNVNRSYPSPTFVETVDNQDLHADTAADMVIVIPSSGKLEQQALRLAKIHESHDDLRVRVLRAGNIYNEFSSGTPDATAIRRYMKMLYDRAENDEDTPRYLLLMGNGLADNRMLTMDHFWYSQDDYLLCYEIDNSASSVGDLHSYCTDDYFGLMDDNEGVSITSEKIDLGIGRLCCTSEAEANILVDKIERYLSNRDAGSWKNEILLMGDYGDSYSHMQDAERVASSMLAADNTVTIHKVYPDAYTWTTASTGHSFPQAMKRIEDHISNGVALINYSGHGAPNQLSHASIVTSASLAKLRTSHYPVWLLASCMIFPIDSEEDNLGRNSMLQDDGGCIGFISATRSVYAYYNNPLNQHVSKYLLGKKADGSRYTFGEALMLGKAAMVTAGNDMTMNKMKYVLVGDPALVLSTPNYQLQLDSINGEPINKSAHYTLKAGSIVRLSGHTDTDDFNGNITINIYDCAETITARNNAKDDVDMTYTYTTHDNLIFSGNGMVTNGKFSLAATIPLDIAYSDESARMVMYAVNDSFQVEASGLFNHFSLNGTDPTAMQDTIPPTVFLYVGNEEFPNGGPVEPSFMLEANITDNYGINSSGKGLGHDMRLVIDGDDANAISVNDYFTYDFGTHLSGHIVYPIESLPPGYHTLTLRAWDINNNSTLATLDVIVQTSVPTNQFAISCTDNPVQGHTKFVTILPDGHDASPLIVSVYSATGQCVWSSELSIQSGQKYASVPWNASTSAGASLTSGIYLLQAKQGSTSTKTKKIIVRRQ